MCNERQDPRQPGSSVALQVNIFEFQYKMLFDTCSRIHNQWAVISSEGNDNDLIQNDTFQGRLDAQKRTFLNWALQWKSITRSSLGNTAYPYCLWIQSLDLRNLKDLLEDNMFREIQEPFFADDMSGFLKMPETPMKMKVRGAKTVARRRLDVQGVLDGIGESITSFISHSASQNRATVAVEDISGDIRATALPRWVSRLAKLKSNNSFQDNILGKWKLTTCFTCRYDVVGWVCTKLERG